MKEFIFLLIDCITIILPIMSIIYVAVNLIESIGEYFEEQSIYNLFMTSMHSIICLAIIREIIPLIISFLKGGIL